jgi:hypothetical protein
LGRGHVTERLERQGPHHPQDVAIALDICRLRCIVYLLRSDNAIILIHLIVKQMIRKLAPMQSSYEMGSKRLRLQAVASKHKEVSHLLRLHILRLLFLLLLQPLPLGLIFSRILFFLLLFIFLLFLLLPVTSGHLHTGVNQALCSRT